MSKKKDAVDPHTVPCTATGGKKHTVILKLGQYRVQCQNCGLYFMRDETWAQGYRPDTGRKT